jgi:hypothetical protein
MPAWEASPVKGMELADGVETAPPAVVDEATMLDEVPTLVV